MDVRKIATRNAEVDRFGAGGEEQSAEALPAAVREPDFSGLGIDRDRAGAELQLDPMQAARWVKVPANQALTGDAFTNALQGQNWDPSVKALVPFPRALESMSDQLQWTEQLGNAFLAQQVDVMAAVQSLRHEAMAAGNLKQTPQCRCVIQTSGETISILPAEPH
jgi:hypothetical protein